MTDNIESSGNPSGDPNISDEMLEYLQTFLDETEEQLDDLVETMLALERESTNADHLNEAFRLIHSIKGSAGMMGLDHITVLTHHLENRFERFRSGLAFLDEPTMNLVLRCIDFLRHCTNRLREGQQLGSAAELLDELKRLEEQADSQGKGDSSTSRDDPHVEQINETQPQRTIQHDEHDFSDTLIRMVVRFRAGLPLTDLKAQLIAARIAGLGDVKSTQPELNLLSDADQLEEFEIRIETHEDLARLREVADVEGVESITFAGATGDSLAEVATKDEPDQDAVTDCPTNSTSDSTISANDLTTSSNSTTAPTDSTPPPSDAKTSFNDTSPIEAVETHQATAARPKTTSVDELSNVFAAAPAEPVAKPAEKAVESATMTMRVDIDRLDNLMNLAGELVVNRARFVQVFGQISPALRKASMLNRIRDFSDTLRHTIEGLENPDDFRGDWSAQIHQLRAGLELMEEQFSVWHNGRQCFSQMSEAIDQLSRVSNGLQRGVLDTRMVPVGPLFNRFKRVVRDLSKERGKKVNLVIRGEKTELDKRMIDELGDPLVHLVRNSIDHGLEAPDVRVDSGKPEAGTIYLEASHSGNNVNIYVRDDGGGIDVEKIKSKLTTNRLLAESTVNKLSDEQALDYIWHPGFSTAQKVTDVSGRGVGMDAVTTRISRLNGTIEVDSKPQQGTAFTIRLPLTLAIINSLLLRIRNVVFSMPIDDVREIVSVAASDVVTVRQKMTFAVRGEIILLVSIDDVFQWHGIDYGYNLAGEPTPTNETDETFEVVILHAAGKTIGLRVDELLGSHDVVIKSLADNFINIRGLSGASVLGDGSVCLMLDVGMVIEMAT